MKGEMPKLLFISPIGHNRVKHRHTHVIFTIEEWDKDGRPLKLILRKDTEIFHTDEIVESGTEFMTAYIPSQMLDPNSDKANKKVK